ATLIHSLFDLTPAEIAVSQAIAAGQTAIQIAATTGRSVATVRNQLRSAMSKTGSTRQIELALLVRQLAQREGL
ncbi:MAG: response regulator transcription factor, partial [Hyphomicrobiales bacterium]